MSQIGTSTPDNLIGGDADIVTEEITLITGQNLTRGSVLGKILYALGTTTYSGTGDGVMSGEVMGADVQIGDYLVTCVTAVTNGGIFSVVAPDGTRLADAVVGTAFVSTQIGFSIADGAADFIVGDEFTVPVIAGSLKYNLSLLAATDGSQIPESILAEDTDATSADKVTLEYRAIEVNENGLTIGTGHTTASITEGLRNKGIFIKTDAITA